MAKVSVLSGILTLIVTLFILFLLLEGGLRLFHPQRLNVNVDPPSTRGSIAQYDETLGWSYIPEAHTVFLGTDVRINEHGMRMSKEIDTPKERFRIAVLGDSFIWGYAVEEEERVSEQLEHLLPGTEVLNFGVSGYGTDQYYLQLQQVLTFEPDLIVVGAYENDFQNAFSSKQYGYEKPLFVVENDSLTLTNVPVPEITVEPKQYSFPLRVNFWLSHYLHSYVFFKPALTQLYNVVMQNEVAVGDPFPYLRINPTENIAEELTLSREIYCAMSQDLSEDNIPLAVFYIPSEFSTTQERLQTFVERASRETGDYDLFALQNYFATAANTCSFQYIDLVTAFSEQEDINELYQGHWTAAGHAFAAEIIAPELEDYLAVTE